MSEVLRRKPRTKIHVIEGLTFFFIVTLIFVFIISHIKNVKKIEASNATIEKLVDRNEELFDRTELIKIDRNGHIHFHSKDDGCLYIIQKGIPIQILNDTCVEIKK